MAFVRLVHTADWQIGMTRHYLAGEAQSRFAQARTDVVARIGRVAADEDADLVVVCGDVFEHEQVTPLTLRRTLEALRSIPVPVWLLPGNHDHLGPLSVWSGAVLRDELPDHVHVLDTAGVHEVAPGVELVAVPWTGKHPDHDLVAEVLSTLPEGPAPEGVVRILVAHGAADLLDPDQHQRAAIAVGPLRAALDEGRIHYVALGDRHSATEVGDPAIRYPGAPEPTDWREERPGHVLVVDVEAGPPGQRGRVGVREEPVASWRYAALDRRIDAEADLEALDRELARVPDKERTCLRLGVSGTVGLALHARLEDVLERHGQLLGALHRPGQHSDLVIIDQGDLDELELGGFLESALRDIRVEAAADAAAGGVGDDFRPDRPDDDESARDALTLLYRLTRGGSR